MAERQKSPKFNGQDLELNELSIILLRTELTTLCDKVCKLVGMSLLREWFCVILTDLESNLELKRDIAIEDWQYLPYYNIDVVESLKNERPNSADSSSTELLTFSEHDNITDVSSGTSTDVASQRDSSPGQGKAMETSKDDVTRQNKFERLGRFFHRRMNRRYSSSDCFTPDSKRQEISVAKKVRSVKCSRRDKNVAKSSRMRTSNRKRREYKISNVKPVLNYVADVESCVAKEDAGIITQTEEWSPANVKVLHECQICNRACRSEIGLKLHLKMHDRLAGAPVCNVCGKQLRNFYGLQQHQRLHTGERPHVCTDCGKTFRTVNILKHHKHTHTGERPFMCHQCDKRYNHASALREHIMCVHNNGVRPFICSQCSSSFPSYNNLRCHEIRCKTDRSHPCEFCPKRYRSLYDLRHHRQVHTGERLEIKAVQTCPHCNKVFKNNYMQLHIRQVHTSERPFKCTECGMTFSMAGSLKSHQLVHSGERAFACTQCDKRLASAYALRNHEAKHRALSLSAKKKPPDSDKRTLSCSHCGEKFARSSNLTVHIKMFHSKVQETAS